METYAINDVERLTGIKAHTLRIWEKRFSGLIAHRTPTQIRYYDDYQVRKLLNIATLLQHGYKISAVMELPDKEIHRLVADLSDVPTAGDLHDVYVNSLIAAMLDFDERSFDKIISGIFIRYGVANAVINIIYPFLRKTGVLWAIDSATPAQEHFASNIIKRKLLTVIDGIPYPANSKKSFLLFLPPDDLHEIGLLFADYMIRSAGYETVYLGQNVPYSNLQVTAKACKPNYLLTFYNSGKDQDDFPPQFAVLAKDNPKAKVIICTTSLFESKLPANLVLLKEPKDLPEVL